jgi:hypothetical protein
MTVDFRKVFAAMRRARRMYVGDDRFLTTVAYVDGCNTATDGDLLNGFQEWLTAKCGIDVGSNHWQAILLANRGLFEEGRSLPELTKEQHDLLVDDMLAALHEFLSTRATAAFPPA